MMLDAGFRSKTQPRAEGEARIGVVRRKGATRLARLRQQGSAKCLIPRVPGRIEAVFLNTAGGLTGGDRLTYAAEVGGGATLTLTTQAAERLYRAQPDETAHVTTQLSLAPGASLDWLPQETIAFDCCALSRRLEIDMAEDAHLLAVEPLVLGRTAHGERVESAYLLDRWRIRRAGRLIYADALHLSGTVAEIVSRPGLFAGHLAAATLVYVAPDAEARLDEARALLPETAGASAWNGLLSVRLLAPDGAALRRALLHFLSHFRAAPLPRVWTM